MEKEFVPYDLALELKELGFDETCFGSIDQIGYIHVKGSKSSPRGSMLYNTINCPTFSQAFRFFREKYKLYGLIEIGTQEFSYQVFDNKGNRQLGTEPMNYNGTYEEAELECLIKLIDIVKKQNVK